MPDTRLPRLIACCLLGSVALAGCSHRSAVVPDGAAAQAPADPGSPDGAWHGSSTRFQADGRGCPGPGLVYAQVFDRQFQLRWGNRASLAAAIAPDGTVSGGNGNVTLTGRFSGSAITADATSPSCGLHYTLRRAT